jgi:hypothetical protein
MAESVLCIVENDDQAESIVQELQDIGFSNDDISVIFPDRGQTKGFAHENRTKAPEGAVIGAGSGGVIGGAIGLLAGLGTLAIPGLGPLIAAGPIMAALSGTAVGATVGGITGALIGLGVPEYEAKLYEDQVKGGNILIAASSESKDKIKQGEQVMKEQAASDVHRITQSSAPRR